MFRCRPGSTIALPLGGGAVTVGWAAGGGRPYQRDDALSILGRIQGSLGFLETTGTRADPSAYRRMRLSLEGSARKVHNMMHQAGIYHDHGEEE